MDFREPLDRLFYQGWGAEVSSEDLGGHGRLSSLMKSSVSPWSRSAAAKAGPDSAALLASLKRSPDTNRECFSSKPW